VTDDDRVARLLADVAAATEGDPTLMVQQLCDAVAPLLGVTGAAVLLMGADGDAGVVYASEGVSAHLADLEFVLHEGPGLDAVRRHEAVLVPDLDGAQQWVGYASEALGAGARAVFGFPLQLGAIRVGALIILRTAAGRLTRDQLTIAFAIAESVTRLLLVADSRPGGDRSGADWTDLDGDWRVVHQATGMVSVQLGVPVGEALARLRAHAFASNQTIRGVAHAVVARRLRLGRDGDGSST
jgi:hypothetical protein